MKKNTIYLIIILMLVAMSAIFVHNTCKYINNLQRPDTIYIRDTVRVIQPVAIDSVGNVRYERVFYTKGINTHKEEENATESDFIASTSIYFDTDTTAVIPISQKHYKDSLYEAWVSGYHPNLDSINIFRSSMVITKEKTVVKEKHFNYGLSVGAGYGIFTHKPDIFVGLGLTYHF